VIGALCLSAESARNESDGYALDGPAAPIAYASLSTWRRQHSWPVLQGEVVVCSHEGETDWFVPHTCAPHPCSVTPRRRPWGRKRNPNRTRTSLQSVMCMARISRMHAHSYAQAPRARPMRVNCCDHYQTYPSRECYVARPCALFSSDITCMPSGTRQRPPTHPCPSALPRSQLPKSTFVV